MSETMAARGRAAIAALVFLSGVVLDQIGAYVWAYPSRYVETRFEPITPRLRELEFSPFRSDLQQLSADRME